MSTAPTNRSSGYSRHLRDPPNSLNQKGKENDQSIRAPPTLVLDWGNIHNWRLRFAGRQFSLEPHLRMRLLLRVLIRDDRKNVRLPETTCTEQVSLNLDAVNGK